MDDMTRDLFTWPVLCCTNCGHPVDGPGVPRWCSECYGHSFAAWHPETLLAKTTKGGGA